MTDISYRLATEVDIPHMVALFNATYKRQVSNAYFSWQFISSYYPTIYLCAFEGERFVGVFGLQKRRLTNGTKVGHLIDLMVSPDYRGKGIFTQLGQRAIAFFPDLDALSVLPNLAGKEACEKAFGMKTIAKINPLLLKKSEEPLEVPIASAATSAQVLLEFEKNDAYRRWRYESNPWYRYTLAAYDTGDMVTKTFTDPSTQETFVDIVDFRAKDDGLRKLAKLFTMGSNTILFDQGFQSITTWALPHTPLYTVLKSLGYSEFPQERYFCVKALCFEAESVYDIRQWNLVQADAEIY